MHQIEISDFTIDVVRKNIKNMHLAVYPPTGRIRIAAPLNIDDDAVKLFAISKLAWIKRNQRNFKQQDRQSARSYIQRESHYFQGRRYLLRVTEHDAPPFVEIKSKTYIDLYIRPETTIAKRNEIMNEWYRTELKKQIPEIIKTWETKLGLEIDDWQVKLMKTKWGSCNIEKRKIWLNLELAKKPIYCLEYIIVHEMLHLLERHHNDIFLNYMNTYLPKWKQIKSELNKLPVSHADWNY
jgi:predicted metal-dependent hydrolase